MRFTSLGSGSSGNGLVVECGATRVMMDCGWSSMTRFKIVSTVLLTSFLTILPSLQAYLRVVRGDVTTAADSCPRLTFKATHNATFDETKAS